MPRDQNCVTQNRTRFLNISKLCQLLGSSVAGALIGMHAFTGCNTVGTLAGCGKVSILKQLTSDMRYQEAFLGLGHAWDVSDELLKKVQEVTYLLRYQPHCTRRGEVLSSQLPPREECLLMHFIRANHQAAVSRRSLQTQPSAPSPKDKGVRHR